MQKDFKFILSVMNGFVKQKSIQKRLNVISGNDITGWEIWFQVEFASYLSSCDLVAEWFREEQFKIDGRKNKIKSKLAVDFLIRQKRFTRGSFIALELKQNNCIETCISKMLDDVVKMGCVRESETFFRSFWNIGIHSKDTKSNIKSKISKKLKQKKITIYDEFLEVRFIPNTEFAYTIF